MKPTLAILLAFCLAAIAVSAADINLAWDAGEPGCTYTVYAHTNVFAYTNRATVGAKFNAGTNLTVTATVQPGITYYLVCTAFKNGLESDFSNMVIAQVPASPGKLRILVLEASHDLTNWTDFGFIKIRIP